MATLNELKDAFQNMIEVMGISDEKTHEAMVIPNNITKDELVKHIQEAIEYIHPDEDEFEETTNGIINELRKVSKESEPDKEPEADNIDDVEDMIDNAGTMKELKDIANSYIIFKSIRGGLSSYKRIGDLKDKMFDILNPQPIIEDPETYKERKALEAVQTVEEEVEEDPAGEPEELEPDKEDTEIPEPEIISEESLEPAYVKKQKKQKPEKSKPEPEVEEKPKPEPEPESKPEKSVKPKKYTRTRAVAETVKKYPDKDVEWIIKEADKIFVENGGQTNIRHSKVQYLIIMQTLEIFGIR